ncbi:hypothetical protein [Pedobacter rhodius]|uniref:Uncharacterized protein n=1 Tax=Pedobacter rhodius TaxID=3004098 RepID=A0ABT4KSE8_9SPHI|nr:hypothetical protein [Pedobacter sp. SJ11]MCZ4221856.1 hypothetical protein [Pedobacter sp. SJ11]
MRNTTTRKNIKEELLVEGLKVAGNAIGINYGKGKIKKSVSRNLSMVDSLMSAAFTRKGNVSYKSQKAIELGSLGFIALYNIIKGVKRKRRGLIAEGIFLSLALGAVIFASNNQNKKVNALPKIGSDKDISYVS